jgi:p24 family protein delta-1
MAFSPFTVIALLLAALRLAAGLKFELVAHPSGSKSERCIRNFANRDTLVMVTAIVDGKRGSGQVVNMHVR